MSAYNLGCKIGEARIGEKRAAVEGRLENTQKELARGSNRDDGSRARLDTSRIRNVFRTLTSNRGNITPPVDGMSNRRWPFFSVYLPVLWCAEIISWQINPRQEIERILARKTDRMEHASAQTGLSPSTGFQRARFSGVGGGKLPSVGSPRIGGLQYRRRRCSARLAGNHVFTLHHSAWIRARGDVFERDVA